MGSSPWLFFRGRRKGFWTRINVDLQDLRQKDENNDLRISELIGVPINFLKEELWSRKLGQDATFP
jgi:hypothetical protein